MKATIIEYDSGTGIVTFQIDNTIDEIDAPATEQIDPADLTTGTRIIVNGDNLSGYVVIGTYV